MRLAEAGHQVTILEKGLHIDPAVDFRQTQDPQYFMKYYRGLSNAQISLRYVEAFGGGSGFYEMASFRAPSVAFLLIDPSNQYSLWPESISRAVMDPYYDKAEQMLSVHQIEAKDVPRNGLIFAKMMKNLGYSVTRARYAAHGCLNSSFCLTGCVYGAKQSLLVTYLPRFARAGGVAVCEIEARQIRPLEGGGYRVTCREAGEEVTWHCKTLILGGGTVGTAKLLLASRGDLEKLSRHVGRNLVQNGCAKTAALLGDEFPDGDMFRGRSHAGMISYQFLESHGMSLFAETRLPLQLVSSARIRPEGTPHHTGWWGAEHTALMERVRTRGFVIAALGFSPPAGRIRLGVGGRLKLQVRPRGRLRSYLARAESLFDTILLNNGCRRLDTEFVNDAGQPHTEPHLSGAHQMASCRMADRPQHGVVDPMGEVFGHPGMFITDGAAIPSSLGVNPSLTILANAERIADGLVARLQ